MKSKYKGFLLYMCMLLCVGSNILISTASALSPTQTASVWVGQLYAEGQPVPNLISADNIKLPVVLFQGSTYFPLRSAGELTGKKVGWDAATQTASLSDQAERVYHDADYQSSAVPEDGSLIVKPAPEIKIIVDGKLITLKDANGETVYPLLYADSTYVPLRSVSELTGYEVKWDRSNGGAECIFIRTPLTANQIQAANTYLYAQIDHMVVLHDLSNKLIWSNPLTENTRTETISAMSAELGRMASEVCPDVPIFTENDKVLRSTIKDSIQTVESMRTASLEEIPNIASKDFRYSNEQDLYIPIINMKTSLDQKVVIDDSYFLKYQFNQNP